MQKRKCDVLIGNPPSCLQREPYSTRYVWIVSASVHGSTSDYFYGIIATLCILLPIAAAVQKTKGHNQ